MGNCFGVFLQILVSCPLFMQLVCPFLQFLITSERELIWLGSGLVQCLLHLVSSLEILKFCAPPPLFSFSNAAMKWSLLIVSCGEKQVVWRVHRELKPTSPFAQAWDSCNVINVDHAMEPLAQEQRGPKLMKRNQISQPALNLHIS